MKINELEPVFVNDDYDLFNDMEIGKLYITSNKFGLVCPCGTHKSNIPIVLPYNIKNGWQLTNNNGLITVNPSILTQPCKAHYFIRDNKIIWV